jgi:hypothetical protein
MDLASFLRSLEADQKSYPGAKTKKTLMENIGFFSQKTI